MARVTVGMSTTGVFTFSPSSGNVQQARGAGQQIVWTVAGTSGNITFPSGAVIKSIPINAGSSGQAWPGNQPSESGSSGQWIVGNGAPANGTVTYEYSVIVSYNNQTFTGDPEIVTDPPGGSHADPVIIPSPPGTKI